MKKYKKYAIFPSIFCILYAICDEKENSQNPKAGTENN